MAMNRYGYLDFNKLELGDLVSWEHPVTGKVYDFEVTELDPKDEYQPVELQLLDGLERGNEINVSVFAEFYGKGSKRWPYKTLAAHEDRNNQDADPNSITLDRLFYTSAHNEQTSGSVGDASREISVLIPEKAVDLGVQRDPIAPSIPSVTELSEIIHISSMDFKTMVVKELAEAIKQGKNFIELPPVLIEMHKEELLDLGYEVRFSAIYWII